MAWASGLGWTPATLDELVTQLVAWDDLGRTNIIPSVEFKNFWEQALADGIGQLVAGGVDVTNFYTSPTFLWEGYVYTRQGKMTFDVTGPNIFYTTPEGERGINFEWKAFLVERKGTITIGGVEYPVETTNFVDFSIFDVPLEEWTKSVVDDRIVLTLTATVPAIANFWGVSTLMDPTSRIVGPPGSANAIVSGDRLILATAAPEPGWLEQPVAIAGIIIILAAIGAAYFVLRRR